MTDSSQNVQKGSGSQSQTGQTGQNPGSSHQGSFDKQHDQGQKQHQPNQGSQTPKKDPQGNEGNQENRNTGTGNR